MRILIDMNLSPRWVDTLAQANIEAVHWSALGAANADDRTIMTAARADGRFILTHDLDFGAILAVAGLDGPSVIQIRTGDVRPDTAGPAVIEALSQCAADLEAGALLTVDVTRFRVSMLPLRRTSSGH